MISILRAYTEAAADRENEAKLKEKTVGERGLTKSVII